MRRVGHSENFADDLVRRRRRPPPPPPIAAMRNQAERQRDRRPSRPPPRPLRASYRPIGVFAENLWARVHPLLPTEFSRRALATDARVRRLNSSFPPCRRREASLSLVFHLFLGFSLALDSPGFFFSRPFTRSSCLARCTRPTRKKDLLDWAYWENRGKLRSRSAVLQYFCIQVL